MRFPFITRRRAAAELAHQARGFYVALRQVAGRNRDAFAALAIELSDIKDEVALHIVAAEHPSSALSDARSMALALREALEARGIDLRLELGRLEGSDL
ncbi:MAG: hypothetical protein HOV92_00645 [Streptomyces sp.]|nr:hypothetical protein [Streptomyces sp.]